MISGWDLVWKVQIWVLILSTHCAVSGKSLLSESQFLPLIWELNDIYTHSDYEHTLGKWTWQRRNTMTVQTLWESAWCTSLICTFSFSLLGSPSLLPPGSWRPGISGSSVPWHLRKRSFIGVISSEGLEVGVWASWCGSVQCTSSTIKKTFM